MKIKIIKWDLIKLKSFLRTKETINKTKTQTPEWEKIFTNEATHKGLIPPNIQTGHAAQYQKKQTTQ